MPRPGVSIQQSETWRMEQFSRAYVKAVASVAGCTYTRVPVDIDSHDLVLGQRRKGSVVTSPRLDVQLKSTHQDFLRPDGVHFPLEKRTYNDLADDHRGVPIILVVVLLPAEVAMWTDHGEEQLALRRCGYWASLQGLVASESDTKTVILPRNQVFGPAALEGIFDRLAAGGAP